MGLSNFVRLVHIEFPLSIFNAIELMQYINTPDCFNRAMAESTLSPDQTEKLTPASKHG